ncbi:MAG: glycosyltransferase [Chitinophagales bacterium]|nr:glycosyltransferase [Chitinophagaceae bacterium]MCB9065069.1 glycosyltransferase [Chitinophagales bacterium]
MKNVMLLGSELGKGGAERSISLLSYYLEQAGYNVVLCILSGTDRTSYYKTCKEIVFVDPPTPTNAIDKIKAWRYRLNKIREIKRTHNIDVSISFLEGPDYVNVLTKDKEKVVLSIRGSKKFDKQISGLMGVVRRTVLIPFLYRKADKIVCVTKALADELKKYFHIKDERLEVIYNFYEPEVILKNAGEQLTEEEEKIFSKKVIITSGRLHMAKEHDKLIQVLKVLKKTDDARVMILGDGDLLQSWVALTESLGMKACIWDGKYQDADVYFMGYQKNAFKFYKHSTVFSLPSSWEGFPNVLAEALICEKPVVSTDCPTGPREILDVAISHHEPITKAIRTKVGTLGPMLLEPSDAVIETWANELSFWLNSAAPCSSDFHELTKRFTLDTLLQEWRQVIDK